MAEGSGEMRNPGDHAKSIKRATALFQSQA